MIGAVLMQGPAGRRGDPRQTLALRRQPLGGLDIASLAGRGLPPDLMAQIMAMVTRGGAEAAAVPQAKAG